MSVNEMQTLTPVDEVVEGPMGWPLSTVSFLYC